MFEILYTIPSQLVPKRLSLGFQFFKINNRPFDCSISDTFVRWWTTRSCSSKTIPSRPSEYCRPIKCNQLDATNFDRH